MSANEALVSVLLLPFVLLLVYLLVRVGAAAFFKSKHQFDRRGGTGVPAAHHSYPPRTDSN